MRLAWPLHAKTLRIRWPVRIVGSRRRAWACSFTGAWRLSPAISICPGHDEEHALGRGCQNRNKLTPAAYFALAQQFQPMNYHPDRWLKAAKEAGFGYAVLTTRHHDGFALWPSKCGTSARGPTSLARPGPRVRRCLSAAGSESRILLFAAGLALRASVSQLRYGTKGTAESPHLGLNHEPAELPERPADFEEQYVSYVNGQLEELLTWYGHIDYLWFDGSAGPKVLSLEQIRKLQPASS